MRSFVNSIWAAALFVLALPLLLHAEPVSQLRPTDYVNDFAHVLDSSTIAQLDDICQQIDQKAQAQIAVVTINSLDGPDIDSYAVDLFKRWGIGSQKSYDGEKRRKEQRRTSKDMIEYGDGKEPFLPATAPSVAVPVVALEFPDGLR